MFAKYFLCALEGLMCSVTETYHRNPFAGEQEVLCKPLPFYYVRDLGTSHVLHCSPPIYSNYLIYSSYSGNTV